MRSNRLARSGGPTVVSVKGASPTTLSALGGPPALMTTDRVHELCKERDWRPTPAGVL